MDKISIAGNGFAVQYERWMITGEQNEAADLMLIAQKEELNGQARTLNIGSEKRIAPPQSASRAL